MYKCPNCGGKIDKDALTCPFCGSENIALLDDVSEDVPAGGGAEIHIKPEDKKNNRRTGIMLAAVIIIAAVLTVAGIIITQRGNEAEELSADINVLEKYYTDGDFAAMKKYLENHPELSGEQFQKYISLSSIYTSVTAGLEGLEKDSGAAALQWDITELVSGLKRLADMGDNGISTENFRRETYAALRDKYGISEEETDRMVAEFKGYDTDFSEIARRIAAKK